MAAGSDSIPSKAHSLLLVRDLVHAECDALVTPVDIGLRTGAHVLCRPECMGSIPVQVFTSLDMCSCPRDRVPLTAAARPTRDFAGDLMAEHAGRVYICVTILAL